MHATRSLHVACPRRLVVRITIAVALVIAVAMPPSGSGGVYAVEPVRQTRASDLDLPAAVAAQDAIQYGRAAIPDNFGGAWIDQRAGRAHVLLKNTGAAATSGVMQNIRNAQLVSFEPASFSEKELEAMKDRIVGDHATLLSNGVELATVGIQVNINKVSNQWC